MKKYLPLEYDFREVILETGMRRLKEGLIVDTSPANEDLIMGFLDYIGVPRQENFPDGIKAWTIDKHFASQV